MRHRRALKSTPQVTALESRALLTAAPHHPAHAVAEVHALAGSFNGTLTYPADAQAATTGVETISGSGRLRGAAVTVAGSDTYTETAITKQINHDRISDGHLVLTAADGTTYTLTYSGSGVSHSTGKQQFAEVIEGTAVSSTGLTYKLHGTSTGRSTSAVAGTIRETFVLTR